MVFCAIEVALRLGDEPIGAYPPLLETADAHTVSRPSRAGVRTCQRPSIDEPVTPFGEIFHEDFHVGESRHESLGHSGDGIPAHGRSVSVDAEKSVGE